MGSYGCLGVCQISTISDALMLNVANIIRFVMRLDKFLDKSVYVIQSLRSCLCLEHQLEKLLLFSCSAL